MDRFAEYDSRIERWRDRLTGLALTDAQAQGWACVECGHDQLATTSTPRPFVPVGFGPLGPLFACVACDAPKMTTT